MLKGNEREEWTLVTRAQTHIHTHTWMDEREEGALVTHTHTHTHTLSLSDRECSVILRLLYGNKRVYILDTGLGLSVYRKDQRRG